MNANEREQLRQELLELSFGCHPEPEELHARIASDPEVRALMEETSGMAEALQRAALHPAPDVDLHVGADCAPRSRWRWRAIAAAALFTPLMVSLGWWGLCAWRHGAIAEERLRLIVSAPPGAPDVAALPVRIETWDGDEQPTAALVSWTVRDRAGAVIGRGERECEGAFDLQLPARLEGRHRIEVTALGHGEEEHGTLEFDSRPGGPLAHLSIDKPLYRPGETVLWRAVLLDRLSLEPLAGRYHLRVVDAQGAVRGQFFENCVEGIIGQAWHVPPEAAGGRYALELRDGGDAFTVESLAFEVRRFQPPRLRKTLVLDRESYAPGSRGIAELEVERLAGGIPAGAVVDASLILDGATVWEERGILDGRGAVSFRFAIPEEVERGDARFAARVRDGGVVETELRTFVVPLEQLEVKLYPEGGELVAGVQCRVYAECFDALGRPASATGRVLDSNGLAVARLATEHQGRGRFEFTPQAGVRYRIAIDAPPCPELVDLPEVRSEGVVLRSLRDSQASGAALRFAVDTPPAGGPWLLGLFCRGSLVAQAHFTGAGHHTLELSPSAAVAGVLRATVFDADLRPVAERLVHRRAAQAIRIEIEREREVLTPGEHLKLRVRTLDERGNPIAAWIGLAVSDQAVRDLVGTRRIGLADQAWLAADVEELTRAEEFLTGDAGAARHIDLLLGTRGWRRFAWKKPAELVAEYGDRARALLVREGRPQVPRVADTRESHRTAVATWWKRVDAAEDLALQAAAFTLLAAFLLGLVAFGRRMAWQRREGKGGSAIAFSAGAMAAIGALLLGLLGLLTMANKQLGADATPRMAALAENVGVAPPVLAAQEAWIDPIEWRGQLKIFGDGAVDGRDVRRFGVVLDSPVAASKIYVGRTGADAATAVEDLTLFVREFAHTHQTEDTRRDFAETLLWKPALLTDENGEAEVEFDLSDRVTTWSIHADAHGGGRLGQARSRFEARLPLHLEAVLPVEVSAGDRLQLPVAIACEQSAIERVEVSVELGPGLRLAEAVDGPVALSAGRGRLLVPVIVEAGTSGETTIALAASAAQWSDRVEQRLRIVPRGFPHSIAQSGVLKDRVDFAVGVPAQHAPGSLTAELKLYPSPLADMLDGMEGMLQEPHGCFEQASSANYPNVLALSFLDAAGVEAAGVAARARGMLERGYAKLTGYECSRNGYEWFGSDPAHEALTAYGLIEFHDMRRVFAVDDGMLARTREWLLERRDGEGGYRRNERALDHFGRAPVAVNDAYITYALAASGTPVASLERELARLARRAVESGDAYELAVAACALQAAGQRAPAELARERLKGMQKRDGGLDGETCSITASRGRDLRVETTSFAILAWLDDPADAAAVESAVRFLRARRSGRGTFGATQATIMALKALTRYAEKRRAFEVGGTLVLVLNDAVIARREIDPEERRAIVFGELAGHLMPGENRFRLVIEGAGDAELPWAFEMRYHSDRPADDSAGQVGLRVELAAQQVEEGQTVALRALVENLDQAAGLPMSMAILGLPAGLEASTRVLEDLKRAGDFDLWERRGRELILYWRQLAPGARRLVSIDLLARVPGTSVGPASRGYLYYAPHASRWAAPLSITVLAVGD